MRRPSVNKDCMYSCRSSKKGRREKNIPFLREMKNFSSRETRYLSKSDDLRSIFSKKSYFPREIGRKRVQKKKKKR